ncbi:hypothetical protein CKO15_03675 [Halorhodospira abdelmalekii]|uniref:3-deoxy-D-manno-octulosonic acid transferase n=1 Tax=Halorhodospira abdelmalekii TaxID=421629 RepID=UPI001905945A|nr:3-deoxy-D-manno-octulosonic acid transferase [Halorhodospira abdelmalekii]MBK1734399.1 hypothetical protein [Halorhodospira abdelmalekii]
MLRTLYTALLYALSPAVILWLLRTSQRRGGTRMLRERLGYYRTPQFERPVWLHCASVGEVRTAAPLIRALQRQRPDLPILLTTATATGAETAVRKLPTTVQHVYQPLDWPGAVKRFLRTHRPRLGVILETEIWPNLYYLSKHHRVPLILANARLSSRSLNAPALARQLQRSALARVDVVLARSTEDAKRFSKLGVDPAHIRTLGSLKLAPPDPDQLPIEPLDLDGRATIVAASTHDDEELRIAQAWAKARSERQVPKLLVIVPRHPERGPGIRDVLRRAGFQVALRSAGETHSDAEIYIADTLGELEMLMAAAEVVIIGGSLIERGGQNLVEPARLGRPILFGPHMENFAEEAERLRAAGGAQRFLDETDLQQALIELFRDPQARRELGEQAAATVTAAQDITALYTDALLRQLRD